MKYNRRNIGFIHNKGEVISSDPMGEEKFKAGDWIKGDKRGSWRKVLKFLMEHDGAYEVLDIVKGTGLAFATVVRAVWKIQNHPNIIKKRHPERKRFFTYQYIEG